MKGHKSSHTRTIFQKKNTKIYLTYFQKWQYKDIIDFLNFQKSKRKRCHGN
jgi:hypothetical protein